jgi:hypothetical protein
MLFERPKIRKIIHVKDLALSLEADILRPLYHARKVSLGLEILTDTKVLGTLLDERILQ